MLSTPSVFAGIDPGAAHKSFTYALLDRELAVTALGEADAEELVQLLGEKPAVTVAINAPAHLNAGLVRRSMADVLAAGKQVRGAEIRLSEHELHQRGIPVSATAGRESACPEWVRIGLALYAALAARGFEPYPVDDCPHQVLETHPHAAFCTLLGRAPLPKPALEGRLQRQLVLYERGMRIRDPLDYFEELTRHKLLHGILPADVLYTPEQLDALAAAYTAWVGSQRPAELARLGALEEGFLYLPTALKEKY